MCVMSAVTPVMAQQWPSISQPVWQQRDLLDLQTILRKLDELDRKMGAKDCAADAPKQEYLAELDRRIKALEKATAQPPH